MPVGTALPFPFVLRICSVTFTGNAPSTLTYVLKTACHWDVTNNDGPTVSKQIPVTNLAFFLLHFNKGLRCFESLTLFLKDKLMAQ